MSSISSALQGVLQQIRQTALAAGREPDSVQLLAVSKTFPAEAIREAWAAGQTAFGENYVQELLDKAHILTDLPVQWHFIGPLQSNKTRPVAEIAHWVHSVDRLKIAERLSAQRPAQMPPLNICLQVNISGEDSKSGVTPSELPALAAAVARLPRLVLRGLMCIPAPTTDPLQQQAAFAALRELYEQLLVDGLALDTLSMGMSADMVAAIREGATMVRVGTAIFGHRHYPGNPA
ncbi:YggS family pyridoxal phosphate-dependent enzyme [Leeia sp. IMCC25680]|uniref:Pyridoxal phosphate homeostasis protein n=2 Tax=Leeia aquatica TaxID=2725557 RepID=A0A847S910_9NEIS|nr:YggS family pyridoxal phosphate-dependent enzyme [Leeia aquatica]NLR76484.1 YggS family pyridoxal phosphate-dependent enzyme [Leeia aquatica]